MNNLSLSKLVVLGGLIGSALLGCMYWFGIFRHEVPKLEANRAQETVGLRSIKGEASTDPLYLRHVLDDLSSRAQMAPMGTQEGNCQHQEIRWIVEDASSSNQDVQIDKLVDRFKTEIQPKCAQLPRS